MIRIIVFLMICFTTFIIACSGKVNLVQKNLGVETGGIIGIRGVWIKDKSDKFDLMVQVKNKTSDPVIISRGNLVCGRNSIKGNLHYTSIDNQGHQWLFEANETKQFYIICQFPRVIDEGQYFFEVRQVYKNKDRDGISRGKALLDKKVILTVDI